MPPDVSEAAVALGGGVACAVVPTGAYRIAAPAVAATIFGLTLASDDGLAWAAGLLGATMSVVASGDPGFGGLTGRRLRLARGLLPALTGTALLAMDADLAAGTIAFAGLLLLGSAALASWRVLRLHTMAAAVLLIGLLLLDVPGDGAAGAALLLAGFAAGAGTAGTGAAPFEAASAEAAPAFPALLAGLLPLAGLGLLLRARLMLVGDGLGAPVGWVLVGLGLGGMVLGAARLWGSDGRRDRGAQHAATGLVVFAFGLGGVAGVHAGLVGLLAASFALPACALARGRGGLLARASRLALGAPPFGMFAAGVLAVDAAGRTLLLPLVAVLCAILGGVARARAATPPGVVSRAVLAAHLAVGGVIGVALPAPVSDRVIGMAERLAGTR